MNETSQEFYDNFKKWVAASNATHLLLKEIRTDCLNGDTTTTARCLLRCGNEYMYDIDVTVNKPLADACVLRALIELRSDKIAHTNVYHTQIAGVLSWEDLMDALRKIT